ncbi:hypothetical protein L6452_24142 [Arctium lappa]|uniref:Uncharacterized protein n=1 Tax=Arctium lappa TaxID=4217 RepID=A0ACB9A901_ARCLA|nr:hypothetical protein L6452_24142 [Arctium lappa]
MEEMRRRDEVRRKEHQEMMEMVTKLTQKHKNEIDVSTTDIPNPNVTGSRLAAALFGSWCIAGTAVNHHLRLLSQMTLGPFTLIGKSYNSLFTTSIVIVTTTVSTKLLIFGTFFNYKLDGTQRW